MKDLVERKRFWFFISSITLTLYLLPLILYGESNYIRIHDNLDITVPMLNILAHSGKIFSGSMEIIPNMMGGLPRLVYGSEFNYLLWLFFFFKPFTALIINEIMIHIVAYVSMMVLLSHLLRNETVEYKTIAIHGASLLFALTPFFTTTGLGVALLPFTLYFLLVIRLDKDRWFHWIGLGVIPFFSNFVLIYLFFLVTVTLFFSIQMVIKKELNRKLLGAIGMMVVLFLAIETRLVVEMFVNHGFISHRSEFIRKAVDLWGAYSGGQNAFLHGQIHSINLQFLYLLPLLHVAIILMLLKNELSVRSSWVAIAFFSLTLFSGVWETVLMSQYYLISMVGFVIISFLYLKQSRLFLGLLAFILWSSLWYGFWYYKGWIEFSHGIALLNMFDFSRFVLLLTPIWYLLFALSSIIVLKKIRYGIVIVALVSLLQLNYAFESAQFYNNPTGLNYQKFYDERMMGEIKEYIGYPTSSYRVASVGIPPAVSLYNDFYTLDGYVANYPLSYKHQFEKLVEKSFPYYPNGYHFIHNWGSKCYLIAGNYDYDEYQKGSIIDNFQFNSQLFYHLGGRYLLSGYKIRNSAENHLIFQKVFISQHGYWNIYLYKLDNISKY
ncbi:MAG: DUF6044 family protein [Sulfuricurvum sp.]|uniref:DUF6044 family protein n=1 Tax=Sulfuricurvum sp. TaxID=2025608 RepID=UPI00263404F0|nr:DUF6044 family protein [Sulfuricurvum sp.]MDD2828571.1 DUF6044 family protein [Sulfuricurvum sp.]MDD4948248.1 DUF6044 family protein [Sulfuricurvum sp.]